MMRARHRAAVLVAGALSVALGASTIAQAQITPGSGVGAPREAPPVPPQPIPGGGPGAQKEAPKASQTIPDSVVGAPREAPSKSEPRPQAPEAEAGGAPEADTAPPPPPPQLSHAAARRGRRAGRPPRRRPLPPPQRAAARAALPSAVAMPVHRRRAARTRGCRPTPHFSAATTRPR